MGLSLAEYTSRFDALAHTLAKSLVIFFVPVFALVFALLARRARRYALEHVTVAVHFTSLLLLLLPLPFPVMYGLSASGMVDRMDGDAIWTLALGLLLGFYATRFLSRVYGSGRWTAIGQAIIVVVAFYLSLIFLYRPVLFFVVHLLV